MKKHHSTRDRDRHVAIAWYRRDQWALLRAKAADPESIENTFDEWLQGASKVERDLRNSGIEVSRIECDVFVMIDWCKREELRFDSEARSQYAAEELRRRSIILQ